MTTVRRSLTILALAAASLAASVAPAAALTYAGAAERATQDATSKFGPGEVFQRCEGPFENVRGKTQYACYGYNQNYCNHWQINLDPYGTITYETHGCPAVRSGSGSSSPSASE